MLDVVNVRLINKALLIFFLSFILIGCSPSKYDSLPDSYNAETDYPYTFPAIYAETAITPGNDGYYFRAANFLFYMDAESREVVPFCNRPDCNHLKEKNPSEVWKCNAYVGQTMFSQLQFCENELYCTTDFDKEDMMLNLSIPTLFTAISEDSSNRRTLGEIKSDTSASKFYIHRGYIYTATSGIEKNGEKFHFKLSRIQLENVKTEVEEVLFEDEFNDPYVVLYGNHFYMGAYIENFDAYCTYDYNIETKKATIISKGKYPIGIIDGKLLLRKPIYDEKPTEVQMFLYDPDTEKETDYLTIPKTEGMASSLDTDGTYLYFLEGSMKAESGDLGEWCLYVYDQKGHCIKEQSLSFLPATINFIPGDDQYAFIYSEMYGEEERYKAVTILDKQNDFSYETVCKYNESLLHPKVSIDLNADS